MSLASIAIDDGEVVIQPNGIHQIFSLRRKITIPLTDIVGIDRETPGWRSARWAILGKRIGTNFPGSYLAGRFRPFEGGGKSDFWLVRNPGQAVRLLLTHHQYGAVIIQVDDPDAFIEQVQEAIARNRRAIEQRSKEQGA